MKVTSVHFPTKNTGHNNTDLLIEHVIKEKKKTRIIILKNYNAKTVSFQPNLAAKAMQLF